RQDVPSGDYGQENTDSPTDGTASGGAENQGSDSDDGNDRPAKGGWVAGVLTFFAVGCPVCNKLVLVALGYAGAISWFAPVQPYLQLIAIGLLLWGLRVRLRGERQCAPKKVTSG